MAIKIITSILKILYLVLLMYSQYFKTLQRIKDYTAERSNKVIQLIQYKDQVLHLHPQRQGVGVKRHPFPLKLVIYQILGLSLLCLILNI